MNLTVRRVLASATTLVSLLASAAFAAPGLTLPPSGDNQRSTVTQGIGLVTVSLEYSSPNVHAPDGSDRKGRIWGELVPYGLSDIGYNDCKECPWRGGANENTVFAVSHDVKVEGQPLKAGRYGLHFIPGREEWTVIFSNNSTSWGSYTYDPKEDALRVQVKPSPAPYREWLTYDFIDREKDHATVAMQWEELSVPIKVEVPNMTDLYMAQIQQDLRSQARFTWVNWNDAARYALRNKRNAEALTWATHAVEDPADGQPNFGTVSTLAMAQMANGKTTEGKATIDRAMTLSTGAIPAYGLARGLQNAGFKDEAMRVYEANAKKYKGAWPSNLGLARGYDDKGDTKKAIEYAKKALAQAPDEPNRKNVERFIGTLEAKLNQNAASN